MLIPIYLKQSLLSVDTLKVLLGEAIAFATKLSIPANRKSSTRAAKIPWIVSSLFQVKTSLSYLHFVAPCFNSSPCIRKYQTREASGSPYSAFLGGNIFSFRLASLGGLSKTRCFSCFSFLESLLLFISCDFLTRFLKEHRYLSRYGCIPSALFLTRIEHTCLTLFTSFQKMIQFFLSLRS